MPHPTDVEDAIMALAARQHGVVARAQLLDAGILSGTIDRRVKRNRLRVLHRGVYGVGPLASRLAREMAAVLACGPRAVVSHRTAGAMLTVVPAVSDHEPVETCTPGSDHSHRPGIRAHRVRTLEPDEVTKLEGIPLTTVARTLVDLAPVIDRRELERALARALRSELTDPGRLLAYLDRHPGRRGTNRMRALLAGHAEPALTNSEAEERLLTLIRNAELPRPSVNAKFGAYELDFLWRDHRLVVEVDGFTYHSSAKMFESDRRRDAALVAAGFRVIRVTYRQLVSKPEALLARLVRALGPPGSV